MEIQGVMNRLIIYIFLFIYLLLFNGCLSKDRSFSEYKISGYRIYACEGQFGYSVYNDDSCYYKFQLVYNNDFVKSILGFCKSENIYVSNIYYGENNRKSFFYISKNDMCQRELDTIFIRIFPAKSSAHEIRLHDSLVIYNVSYKKDSNNISFYKYVNNLVVANILTNKTLDSICCLGSGNIHITSETHSISYDNRYFSFRDYYPDESSKLKSKKYTSVLYIRDIINKKTIIVDSMGSNPSFSTHYPILTYSKNDTIKMYNYKSNTYTNRFVLPRNIKDEVYNIIWSNDGKYAIIWVKEHYTFKHSTYTNYVIPIDNNKEIMQSKDNVYIIAWRSI